MYKSRDADQQRDSTQIVLKTTLTIDEGQTYTFINKLTIKMIIVGKDTSVIALNIYNVLLSVNCNMYDQVKIDSIKVDINQVHVSHQKM